MPFLRVVVGVLFAAGLICLPVSAKPLKATPKYRDLPDLTSLGNAARFQDLQRATDLLRSGVDVNAREKNGETALYDALECNRPVCDNVPMIRLLLDSGANLNLQLPLWSTPLTFSLTRQYANPAATLTLLRKGAIVRRDCHAPETNDLSYATQDSSMEVMRLMLELGANPNCMDEHTVTPVYWATINGQPQRAELLLQHGADPNLIAPCVYDNSRLVPLLDCTRTTYPDSRVKKDFEDTRAVLKRYGAKSTATTR